MLLEVFDLTLIRLLGGLFGSNRPSSTSAGSKPKPGGKTPSLFDDDSPAADQSSNLAAAAERRSTSTTAGASSRAFCTSSPLTVEGIACQIAAIAIIIIVALHVGALLRELVEHDGEVGVVRAPVPEVRDRKSVV